MTTTTELNSEIGRRFKGALERKTKKIPPGTNVSLIIELVGTTVADQFTVA